MRWMKKLLLGIYIYMGVFFGICLLVWIFTGNEPAALIAGISAAVGVESVAAGFIRIYENREQYKHEKEISGYGTEHDGTGNRWSGGEDQLETEAEFPEIPDDDRGDGNSSGGISV